MNARSRRVGIACAIPAALLVVVGWVLLHAPATEPPPLPDPNGYDDFVRAAQRLVVAPGDREPAPEELEAMVESNAPALRLLRTGLAKECRVPLSYELEELHSWASEFTDLKRLARALRDESTLAARQGRPVDAADSALDLIQFGVQSTEGGLLIHALLRCAFIQMGAEELERQLPELDADQLRRVAEDLAVRIERLDSGEGFLERERLWSRQSFSTPRIVAARVSMAIQTRSLRPLRSAYQQSIQRYNLAILSLRELLLTVAARAYEIEQGHPPQSATELAPDYLRSIPIDPMNGEPMELPPGSG